MAWSGIITNAGQEMLNQVATGEYTLHIVRAEVGSGYRQADALPDATGLSVKMDDASIVARETTESGVRIKMSVYASQTTSYYAREFGLYANLTNGQVKLFMIFQDDGNNVRVPLSIRPMDFIFTLCVDLVLTNTDGLEVEIESGVYATLSMVNGMFSALQATAATMNTGLISGTDKQKLSGIEAQANRYVHPAYSPQEAAPEETQAPGFGESFSVPRVGRDATGHVAVSEGTVTIPGSVATGAKDGLMSADDKVRLSTLANTVNSLTGNITFYGLSGVTDRQSCVSELGGSVAKVGKLVLLRFEITLSEAASGFMLNFKSSTNDKYRSAAEIWGVAWQQDNAEPLAARVLTNNIYVQSALGNDLPAGKKIRGTIVYFSV